MTSPHDPDSDDLALQKVFAFSIVQQRMLDPQAFVPPRGGSVTLTPRLEGLVQAAFEKVQPQKLTTVDFELGVDGDHPLRDALMQLAFGSAAQARKQAAWVASRLSSMMDNRSRAGLLLVTVEAVDNDRCLSLLLLPREDVIQLNSDKDVELALLKDAFPSKSELRKFARTRGHRSDGQFLAVEVLDTQRPGDKDSADYWVRDFLRARTRISARRGTQMLSHALRRAFEVATNGERDMVLAAMLTARSGHVKRTSLKRFAEAQVPPSLHERYFHSVPEEAQRALFSVSADIVRAELGSYVFEAEDGVIVTAPPEAVGKSVTVSGHGADRQINYHGIVKRERVKKSGR